MAIKVFVTGATGYIGGDALFQINETHPDWEITALVRNSDKGALVAKVYPRTKLVYGDLDSVDLIEEQAAAADIVYHFADCDHVPSAEAIARGLARSPSYWIHTSGTGVLCWKTMEDKSYGEAGGEVYDDWSNIGKVTSLPDQALHRNVDKIVLAAHEKEGVKTAIVCPPLIYGKGRGPGNTRSVQLPLAAKVTLQLKKGFKVGKGENRWGAIHVADLSRLYVRLGEAAVAGGAPATWNDEGYYFVEQETFKWGDLFEAVAEEARKQGYVETKEFEQFSAEEAVDKIGPYTAVLVGTDSVGHAMRAKKLLAWQPEEHSVFKEIPAAIESEAQALGIVKSHAEKVQG